MHKINIPGCQLGIPLDFISPSSGFKKFIKYTRILRILGIVEQTENKYIFDRNVMEDINCVISSFVFQQL
jgi:hypothetical protein